VRYFLLDQVTSIEVGKSISGLKCITLADEVLHDHFPDFPVLPGALITEGLAQLSGFLLELTFNKDESKEIRRAVLVQIEKMKFYTTSGPGDRLEFKATLESALPEAAQVTVEATCDGEKRASGKLMFAMLKIDSELVTAQRKEIYKIWTRKLKDHPVFR
jgi:3-hydroxyacyl-[acyl-carrier-protein] dehydratase